MKYGIKHKNGTVVAISRFAKKLQTGFNKLTKAEFEVLSASHESDPFQVYDPKKKTLTKNNELLSEIEKSRTKKLQWQALQALDAEISLMSRLGQDTSKKEQDFNAKKEAWKTE